jgi:aerobic-type carbon monoxide dehydrogenase small subunit (CoxS/CutS family)
MTLIINGDAHRIDVDGYTPMQWALRDVIGLARAQPGMEEEG